MDGVIFPQPAAVKAAMAGDVDAVVAAPQHETSIAQAGIPFDGHPSFVARQTGTDESGVYTFPSVPPGAFKVTVTFPYVIGVPSLSRTVALRRTLSHRFGAWGV